jgi:alanine racemase
MTEVGRVTRLAGFPQSAYTTPLVFKPSTAPRSRAWVEVRLDRLRDNALAVQSALHPGRALIPMVKADAYGLGMEAVVRALRDTPELRVWAFGVAAVSEGEQLRALWPGRILVFSPPPPQDFERAAAARLTLCLSDLDAVRRWAAAAEAVGERLALHTEIDTGMGRAGFPWSAAAEWAPAVAAQRERVAWEGVFTHFHSADEPELAPTETQLQRFARALQAVRPVLPAPPVVHVANSAAALRGGGFGYDLARPGIFLYGGEAGAERSPAAVASVHARLALVREVEAGATVGYGAEYTARRTERWGTLCIGYGDGVRRSLWRGGGEVLVRGRRVPIIGRVSMDLTTIDLSGVPEAEVGDVATLVGRDGAEEITLDQVAARCGTISYEILTGLTPRLPRVYLGE